MFLKDFKSYEFPLLGWIKIPSLEILPEHESLPFRGDKSDYGYMAALTRQGWADVIANGKIDFKNNTKEQYLKRIKHELEIIKKLQFAPYFLLIHRIYAYCDRENILTGLGRGSGGGSIVLYLMGITHVDPVKYNLLFERFLSADRAETKEIDGEVYLSSGFLADFDMDVQHDRRDDVINFIKTLFNDQICLISTVSTLTGKALLKDVLKTYLLFDETKAKKVTSMIPTIFGKVQSLETALEENEEFIAFYNADPMHKKAVDICLRLQGLTRQKGVHAAALFVSNHPVRDVLPVELASDKRVVTAIEMKDAEKMGIKVDVLGIQTLSVVGEVLNQVGVNMLDIDLEDPTVYKFLNETDKYYGLFQIGDGIGKDTVLKVKPNNLTELAHCSALGRPGAMAYIDDYVKYRETGEFHSVDPAVDKVTKNTGGIIIYQEQLMALSRELAGFTGKQADGIRKAVGKKIKEKMDEYKVLFYEGAKKKGHAESLIDTVWASFNASASYSFNLSHAIAYSGLCAITAYIKAKYPVEFFVALLNNSANKQKPMDEIQRIVQELPHFGIKLLPPSLSKSGLNFTKEGENIRFGLAHIKGHGAKTFEKLVDFRPEDESLLHFLFSAKEGDLSISVLTTLIAAGCFDEFLGGKSRAFLILQAKAFYTMTDRELNHLLPLIDKYKNNTIFEIIHAFSETELTKPKSKSAKPKPIIAEKRLGTIRKRLANDIEAAKKTRGKTSLTNYLNEKYYLGYSHSTSLKNIYGADEDHLYTIADIQNMEINRDMPPLVSFMGQVQDSFGGVTRNDKPWHKLSVADESGCMDVFLWEDSVDEVKQSHEGKLPDSGELVFVRGKWNGEKLYSPYVSVQNIEGLSKV